MLLCRLKRRLAALGGAFLLIVSTFTPLAADPIRQTAGDQIEQIMARMSPTQKVAQMFMVSLWGETLTEEGAAFLQEYNPGGVILFGYNTGSPDQITRLTNAIQAAAQQSRYNAAPWIAVDQEGGLVSRLSNGFTTFPVSMLIAATGQPSYAHAVGAAMAEELRAVGITMDLAPVADIETNPNNPIIARRAFSSDPQITGDMVGALVEGLQSGGVMAAAKHFPGHGDTQTDSHIEMPVANLDRTRLDAVELVPFRQAINVDVGTIMVSHIWFPELEPEPNTPASLSGPIQSGLLRGDLGFDGLIMTDALDMDAIDRHYTLADAAKLAIIAGSDLITPGPHVSIVTQRAAIDAVVDAIESGDISLSRIDDSVRRILVQKARFGVLQAQTLDPETAGARINRPVHEALVDDVIRAAVTLVYDRKDSVPLDASQPVALVYPATNPSIARQCESYDPDLILVGVSAGPTDEEIGWAAGAAQQAETVVVFTWDAVNNPSQQRLVNALPAEKTVVVALRSPYDWQHFPQISGYLTTYSPLPAAFPAACAALYGAQPITGVLPLALDGTLPAGSGVIRP